MKKISIVVQCFNEEKNVGPIAEKIVALFDNELSNYSYELIFIDNASDDGTIDKIRKLCKKNKKIKAILNIKNIGDFNSPYHAMLESTGDCTILMACDFQDPVEMLPKFVKEWGKGYKLVVGVKDKSDESSIVYFLRTIYYNTLKKLSNINIIRHFTGFGLYDKEFIQLLASLDDPTPFLRGIVGEYGYDIKTVSYTQPVRKHGSEQIQH